MVVFTIYSESEDMRNDMLLYLKKYAREYETRTVTFQFPMDLIDYINHSQPRNCVVLYHCMACEESYSAIEKIKSISESTRVVLICDRCVDIEMLFYYGVSYYCTTRYIEESVDRFLIKSEVFIDKSRERILTLQCKSGIEMIKYSQIQYISSDKRKITVYDGKTERRFYYKLDEIEQMLGEGFLRCHQSFLVNIQCIYRFVEDGIVLNNDVFIPVSRNRYYASKRKFLEYTLDSKNINIIDGEGHD